MWHVKAAYESRTGPTGNETSGGEDGLDFDPAMVSADRIKEDHEYEGVRSPARCASGRLASRSPARSNGPDLCRGNYCGTIV